MDVNGLVLAYEKGYRSNEFGEVKGLYKDKLSLCKGSNGYLLFRIRNGKKFINVPVHRFSAYCKYGDEIFDHDCVRHINGNKEDNRFSNLTLGSYADNYADINLKWRNKFAEKGAETKRKLNEEQVIEIRKMLKAGHSYREVSTKFRVSKATIQQVKEGKSYKWVM